MIRRTLVISMIGLAMVAARPGPTVSADDNPRISNISVGVSAGVVTYYVCVQAIVPPTSGAVTIAGPGSSTAQKFAALSYNDEGCGGSNPTYLMTAVFSKLAAGAYTFLAADAMDHSGALAVLGRDTGFESNFYGDTVADSCQVDFDTTKGDVAPRNCAPSHSNGIAGDLTVVGPPPPTATDTPTPTDTPSPTPTDTPSPTPTNTPVPSPTATKTPTAPKQAVRLTLSPGTVRPGSQAHIGVSYARRALIRVRVAFPGVPPTTLVDETGDHGHVTLALQVPANVKLAHGHGHATVSVWAAVGVWRRIMLFSTAVRPASTEPIAVTYAANTPLRVVLVLAGQPARTLFGMTDRSGQLALSVEVPRAARRHRAQMNAQVSVWTIQSTRSATTTRAWALLAGPHANRKKR